MIRSDIIVRRVPPDALIDLRHAVLRADLPRDSAIFDGDHEPTAIHLGAFDAAGAVVGCVTLLRRGWKDAAAWQLRGMAVDATLRRTGVGTLLLAEVDRIVAASDHSRQLWCNGRLVAKAFYERHGWTAHGVAFDIPTAGPHFLMSKRIDG